MGDGQSKVRRCEGGKVGKWEIGDWRWEIGDGVESRGTLINLELRNSGIACLAVASHPLHQELKKTKVSR